MKGIVFTLDAIFALIIAMASISILLYFHYFSQTPYLVNYQKAQEIAQMLAGTEIANIQNSSQIAASIARQSQGYNYTWPQFMNNAYAEAQNPYGPFEPFVSYIFTAPNPITTGIVAGYGNIYFASGTTSSATLFAVNASTNATRWTKATSEIVSTPVLYNNMLIYINQTNMTAVSPLNGSTIWTTNTIVSGTLFSSTRVTTPLIAYDSKVFFGTSSDNVYAMYLNNKTLAWSVSAGSGDVTPSEGLLHAIPAELPCIAISISSPEVVLTTRFPCAIAMNCGCSPAPVLTLHASVLLLRYIAYTLPLEVPKKTLLSYAISGVVTFVLEKSVPLAIVFVVHIVLPLSGDTAVMFVWLMYISILL